MQEVEIRVRGEMDINWSGWFDGLTITHTPRGETVLAGPVRDQPKLRGILSRLADLGLELISVTTKPGVHKLSRRGGDGQTKRKSC
jgi:hypothetical protein